MKHRKVISILLTVCMILTLAPAAVFADTGQTGHASENRQAGSAAASVQEFTDLNGHWAEDSITKWAALGIVKGEAGAFRPNDPITRAELAVILDNLMDYQTAADNTFTDVKKGAWYEDAVLKANAAGILNGDGTGHALPNARVTREQAAVMLARAFGVDESTKEKTAFHDADSVSNWAKGLVFGMEADKYIGGLENGSFAPKANITRAQVVTIIDNAVKAYYTKAGTYTDNVASETGGANCLAIVRSTGVTIKGSDISGDLIIAEGVGEGDFTLDGSTVEGKMIARGGGENSIHIINGADVNGTVSVEKVNGIVRIVSNGVVIKTLEADAEVILEGEFTNISVSEGASIEVKGKVANLDVKGKAEIKAAKDSVIEAVKIENDAKGTDFDIDKSAAVNRLEANADITTSGAGAPKIVTGSGTVTNKAATGAVTSAGGGGGNNGGHPAAADKRSLTVKEECKNISCVMNDSDGSFVFFDGTDQNGAACKGLELGTLSVTVDGAALPAADYSVSTPSGLVVFYGTKLTGFSTGKHNVDFKITASDGKVLTEMCTLYLVPPTAGILFDQPAAGTVTVTRDSDDSSISKGDVVDVTNGNTISVRLSDLPSNKRVKSATVSNNYYGYTETLDYTEKLISNKKILGIMPRGVTTITIVTEDIPASLPKITGAEFYLGYDQASETYSQKVTTEVPAMAAGGDSLISIYARAVMEDGTTCRYATYAWVLESGGSNIPIKSGKTKSCPLYTAGTDADSVMKLTVTGDGAYTTGTVNASIIIKKPLASQSAPTLTASAVSSAAAKDGKIIGTTVDMEYKLSTAGDSAYVSCMAGETTGLAAGSYDVRLKAKQGFAAGACATVIINQPQAAPTGLTGEAPATSSGSGKIKGTTTAMQYKLSTAADNAYMECMDGGTIGVAPGTYSVRFKAKSGYDASAAVTVTIPAYVKGEQTAPTGLTTEATSSSKSTDGKIIGTTEAMEYKLASAADSEYETCGDPDTGNLAGGTYVVRFRATSEKSASPTVTVTVDSPAAKHIAELENLVIRYVPRGGGSASVSIGFTPDTLEYTGVVVNDPKGGDSFWLDGTPAEDSFATTSSPAVSLDSNYEATATLVVTSEDGQVSKTYTVHFFVQRKTVSITSCVDLEQTKGSLKDSGAVFTLEPINGDGNPCSISKYGDLSVKIKNSATTDLPSELDSQYYTVDSENKTVTINKSFFEDSAAGSYYVYLTLTSGDLNWTVYAASGIPTIVIK